MESLGLAAGTVNQRLAAVRRLAYEAADSALSLRRSKKASQSANRWNLLRPYFTFKGLGQGPFSSSPPRRLDTFNYLLNSADFGGLGHLPAMVALQSKRHPQKG